MEIWLIGEQIWKVDPVQKSEWQFVISEQTSINGLSSDFVWSRKYTSNTKGVTPTLHGNNTGAQYSQIVNLPARYVYSHTSTPCAEFFTPDAYAQDSQHDTDFDPDMLTDEETSTG